MVYPVTRVNQYQTESNRFGSYKTQTRVIDRKKIKSWSVYFYVQNGGDTKTHLFKEFFRMGKELKELRQED